MGSQHCHQCQRIGKLCFHFAHRFIVGRVIFVGNGFSITGYQDEAFLSPAIGRKVCIGFWIDLSQVGIVRLKWVASAGSDLTIESAFSWGLTFQHIDAIPLDRYSRSAAADHPPEAGYTIEP